MDIVNLSGTYTLCKPLFHEKGKILLTSCGCILQILSSQTGELIYRLNGHSSNITSIVNHPTNSNYILSSSSDGLIILWNLETNEEISRLQIPLSILEIIPILSSEKDLQGFPHELVLVVERSAKEGSDQGGAKVVIYNLEKKKIRKNISDLKHISNCCDLLPMSQSPKIPFHYLVVANKRKLIFWSLGTQSSPESLIDRPLAISKGYPGEQIHTICSSSSTTISSLVVCPERDMIITGHESGEMTLWHNISSFLFNATTKQQAKLTHEPFPPPPCTLLHWHAHPVLSLSLSSDSTHVYSGGYEGVLVSWQLSTTNHTFVPRLGGTILRMSANKENSFVAVACSDNSLKLVNAATMREDWMIQSPCLGVANKDIAQAGTTIIDPQTHPSGGNKYSKIQLGVNPITGNVVTNGYPGQLQMTDITSLPIDPDSPQKSSSFVTDSLQVLAYNRISRTENPLSGFDRDRQAALANLKYYVPSVVQFLFHTFPALSNQADEKHYLATIDLYRGEELDPDCSLKIWNYSALDGTQRKFVLLTQVDRPHGSHRITSMTFFTSNPLRPSLATASTDGMVKIWATSASNTKDQSQFWICLYSFTYRNCVASGLSVSHDSSLLAIGYGTALTFWDPNTAELKGSVQLQSSSPIYKTSFIEPRYSMELGGGCGLAYVVAVTAESINVVNILSLEILWSRKGQIFSYAAATSDAQVLKFGEDKSVPITSASSQHLSSEGWFAVCMKDDDISDTQIHIFSPISEIPLYSTSSSVLDMTFWRSPDPTFRYSRGLIGVTKESQLMLYSPTSTTGTSSSFTPINITHHQSYRKKMTIKDGSFLQSVLSAPITLQKEKRKRKNQSDSDSDSEEIEIDTRRQKKMLTKISSEIFDTSSTSLPPLSTIYEDYMKKMLSDSNSSESAPSGSSPISSPPPMPPKVESQPHQPSAVLDRKRIRSQLASVFASSSPVVIAPAPESTVSAVMAQPTPSKTRANSDLGTSEDDRVDNIPSAKKSRRSKVPAVVEEERTDQSIVEEPIVSEIPKSRKGKNGNQQEVAITPTDTSTEEPKEAEKSKTRKGKKEQDSIKVTPDEAEEATPSETVKPEELPTEKSKSRKGKNTKQETESESAAVVSEESKPVEESGKSSRSRKGKKDIQEVPQSEAREPSEVITKVSTDKPKSRKGKKEVETATLEPSPAVVEKEEGTKMSTRSTRASSKK